MLRRNQGVPGSILLPSTWAFKIKRFPDGSLSKYKSRFCAGGHRQIEEVDFFETFAPVVNRTTVRLLLILSQVLNLSTKQVDYTAALINAPINDIVYVETP
jgi:Reverse transcriptase (RNA-dependent DNA polymerase)